LSSKLVFVENNVLLGSRFLRTNNCPFILEITDLIGSCIQRTYLNYPWYTCNSTAWSFE